VTQGDSVTIGYNKSQHQHRQRFTVAHEIGHLLLGHTSGSFILDLNSGKPEEIEANQFAAELLMPLAMLENDIKNGMKNAKNIAMLYNVSEEAVWWKIVDCKLISKL
jgi:Zn-dependent peptidase ImmA (M78 family)